ncbi:MAG: MlaE family ABC transporter permease [Thermodesulfobacteriota bacterium]
MTAFFNTTGGILSLFFQSLYWCRDAVWNFDKILFQINEIGNNTLPVATLIALSSGAVLSLQSGPTLASFGIEENLGSIVGLSMVKEIGPIMGAILVAGRVGSAMAAEIGSMSVYDEIDALKTMNINPVRFLVMPRFLATILSLPVLVIFMVVVGWFGGAVVASINPEISLSMQVYFRNLADFVTVKALFNGLIKSFIFGIIISIVSCYVGLGTKGGPREIGNSVTKAVVLSFILVLVSDYFITRILLFFNLD